MPGKLETLLAPFSSLLSSLRAHHPPPFSSFPPRRSFVPASVDAAYPNACYLKQSGGGWTVQNRTGVTSGTVQGVSVQVPTGSTSSSNITTIQTVYNTVTNNYVSYQLEWCAPPRVRRQGTDLQGL